MNNLSSLQRYFPITGTAESDRAILDVAFVNAEESLDILNPPSVTPRLLIGRKGSGKSAFLHFFRSRFIEAGIPVLFLNPENLDLSEFDPDDAMGEMVKKAKDCLLRCVAVEIGKQLKIFLTKKHETILDGHLISIGAKPKDFTQKLHGILTELAKVATVVDFSKISDALQSATREQIEFSIYQNVGLSGKAFFIMIDDTDQVAMPADPNQLNRIWAFILAARSILGECHEIRFIISLRLEVWIRLERDNASQRDQVDHFRGAVHKLNPSEEHVKSIVIKRFELAKKDADKKKTMAKIDSVGDVFSPFFQEQGVIIPTSKNNVFTSWEDLIIKRSRERPRDAIQLVAMLIAATIKLKNSKVNQAVIADTLKIYSKERADDIARETAAECPQLKEVIRSFANMKFDRDSFKAGAETIMNHLTRLPGQTGIFLYGKSLGTTNKNDIFSLWRFLFDIGFFGARIETAFSNNRPKGFNHLMVLDTPDLISKDRWNEMQKCTWEINPAYRDFLISENIGAHLR